MTNKTLKVCISFSLFITCVVRLVVKVLRLQTLSNLLNVKHVVFSTAMPRLLILYVAVASRSQYHDQNLVTHFAVH